MQRWFFSVWHEHVYSQILCSWPMPWLKALYSARHVLSPWGTAPFSNPTRCPLDGKSENAKFGATCSVRVMKKVLPLCSLQTPSSKFEPRTSNETPLRHGSFIVQCFKLSNLVLYFSHPRGYGVQTKNEHVLVGISVPIFFDIWGRFWSIAIWNRITKYQLNPSAMERVCRYEFHSTAISTTVLFQKFGFVPKWTTISW